MRDLDDPANPYRGSYGEWDRWMYEHRCDPTDQHFFHPQPDDPDNWLNIQTRVDHDGYLLPLMENYRINNEIFRDRSTLPPVASCSRWARAYGVMNAGLIEQLRDAEVVSRADYLPPIPEWLVDNPPLWTIFLPDGEICTLGEPGSGVDYRPGSSGVKGHVPTGWEGECWHRYSVDGRLHGSTEPGEDWVMLYFPGYQDLVDHYYGLSEYTNHYIRNGYIYFYDMDDWKLRYPLYDYDGTEMPEGHRMYDRDNHGFAGLQGGYLRMIYDAQQGVEGE